MARQLLIVSTSTIHGSGYLEYILDEVADFFAGRSRVLFIPFARPGGITHEEYTALAREKFALKGIDVTGIHEAADPIAAIGEAEGFFTGGGNTFVLLKELYDRGLIEPLKAAVEQGTPYMGTSAGANLTGMTIRTTNDMPIVYPPSFDALQLVPFNINPHYLDPDPNSTHKGETRETRINEFHKFNHLRVVGLREGSWLRLQDGQLTLKGPHTARIFMAGQKPVEQEPGNVSDWL